MRSLHGVRTFYMEDDISPFLVIPSVLNLTFSFSVPLKVHDNTVTSLRHVLA